MLIIYVAGFVFSWRSFAIGMLISLEKDVPTVGLDGESRAMAAFVGTILAAIWPLAIPIRFIFRLKSGTILRTPKEIERARKAELKAYRELAREHGLPIPDVRIPE
jgi:hypothetical protein